MTTNLGSTTLRNVPDVALTADNIFVIADNGTNYSVGGTSAAAPLWAGFTALINQQAALFGNPTVGFLNPAIYAIGKGPNYNLDFHDITTGNNTNKNVGNKYFAVPGYDLCTGWGTPNGANLINALAPPLAFQMVTQTNNAILFAWNTVTGLVYQVQYNTNLLQTNWLNLDSPITATNTTTTASNMIGTDPQRFYRVWLTQ
jgi:subtilase family serine protease